MTYEILEAVVTAVGEEIGTVARGHDEEIAALRAEAKALREELEQ